jgi:hypothetical protein
VCGHAFCTRDQSPYLYHRPTAACRTSFTTRYDSRKKDVVLGSLGISIENDAAGYSFAESRKRIPKC